MNVSNYTYDGTSQVTVTNKNIHIDLYECTLFVQIIYIHTGHMITYTYCVKSIIRWHVTGTVSSNNIYVKCIYKQILHIFTHIIVRVCVLCVCVLQREHVYMTSVYIHEVYIFSPVIDSHIHTYSFACI